METVTKTDTKTSNSKAAANLVRPKTQEPDKNGIEGVEAVGVQAKLSIGRPGDKYEQEADAVAEKVVSMPDQSPVSGKSRRGQVQQKTITTGITPWVQKQTADSTVQQAQSNGKEGPEKLQLLEEEDQEQQVAPKLQMMEDDRERLAPKLQLREDEETAVLPKPIQTKRFSPESTPSSSLEGRLNKSKGGGSALPDDTRSFMESGIGADFSQVKVHTGSDAVQMNKELGAQAFTHGKNVYFNQGKYDPGSNSGKKLLAHELTHTVQQGGEKVQRIQRKAFSNAVVYNEKQHDFNPYLVKNLYLVSGNNKLWRWTLREGKIGRYFVLLVMAAQRAMGIKADGYLGSTTIGRGMWYLRRVRYNRERHAFDSSLVVRLAEVSKQQELYSHVMELEFLGADFVRLVIKAQKAMKITADGMLGEKTTQKLFEFKDELPEKLKEKDQEQGIKIPGATLISEPTETEGGSIKKISALGEALWYLYKGEYIKGSQSNPQIYAKLMLEIIKKSSNLENLNTIRKERVIRLPSKRTARRKLRIANEKGESGSKNQIYEPFEINAGKNKSFGLKFELDELPPIPIFKVTPNFIIDGHLKLTGKLDVIPANAADVQLNVKNFKDFELKASKAIKNYSSGLEVTGFFSGPLKISSTFKTKTNEIKFGFSPPNTLFLETYQIFDLVHNKEINIKGKVGIKGQLNFYPRRRVHVESLELIRDFINDVVRTGKDATEAARTFLRENPQVLTYLGKAYGVLLSVGALVLVVGALILSLFRLEGASTAMYTAALAMMAVAEGLLRQPDR